MSVVYFNQQEQSDHILVSPASPENAINVCLFNCLVLSSEALRMVAPLIAALEVAMRVKSLPVMPSRTSLQKREIVSTLKVVLQEQRASYMLKLMKRETVAGGFGSSPEPHAFVAASRSSDQFSVSLSPATLGENFNFSDSREFI
jgi:hypothetical protein